MPSDTLTTLRVLWAPPVPPSFPPRLLFYRLYTWPFPERHLVGTVQYLAFSDLLLSLGNIHLRFLHVFASFESSFLFCAEYRRAVWM